MMGRAVVLPCCFGLGCEIVGRPALVSLDSVAHQVGIVFSAFKRRKMFALLLSGGIALQSVTRDNDIGIGCPVGLARLRFKGVSRASCRA